MNLTRSRQFEIRSIESRVKIPEGFAVGVVVGVVDGTAVGPSDSSVVDNEGVVVVGLIDETPGGGGG
jgi:hypothetical protein